MKKVNGQNKIDQLAGLLLFFGICASPLMSDIKNINSPDLMQREAAVKAFKQEQKIVIQQLINIAGEKDKKLSRTDDSAATIKNPWRESKHLAILLLGDLRAIEAVPILIENIEYKNPKSIIISSFQEVDFLFPAIEALAKIGMPAIDPVIEKLGIYDKECQGRKNCAWIIKKVLGVKLGRYKLQLAIEATKDEKVKKNLQAVLPGFKILQEQLNAERARRDKEKQKQK